MSLRRVSGGSSAPLCRTVTDLNQLQSCDCMVIDVLAKRLDKTGATTVAVLRSSSSRSRYVSQACILPEPSPTICSVSRLSDDPWCWLRRETREGTGAACTNLRKGFLTPLFDWTPPSFLAGNYNRSRLNVDCKPKYSGLIHSRFITDPKVSVSGGVKSKLTASFLSDQPGPTSLLWCWNQRRWTQVTIFQLHCQYGKVSTLMRLNPESSKHTSLKIRAHNIA